MYKINSHIAIFKLLTDYYRSKIISQHFQLNQRIDPITRIMDLHSVSREIVKIVLICMAKEEFIIFQADKGTFTTRQANTNNTRELKIPFFI